MAVFNFMIMKEIKLSQGLYAQVSDEDYENVNQYKWCAVKERDRFYAMRKSKIAGKKKSIFMHRFILGKDCEGLIIDHKDGDGINNQRWNLRPCTNSENLMNRGPNKNGSSKYKGVHWNKARNIWAVSITINKVERFIGHFHDEIEAAKYYDKKAVEVYGEFAKLNF